MILVLLQILATVLAAGLQLALFLALSAAARRRAHTPTLADCKVCRGYCERAPLPGPDWVPPVHVRGEFGPLEVRTRTYA